MYDTQIWFPNRTNIEKLEKIQSSVARWISRETSYKNRLIYLHLLPISLLLQLSDIIFNSSLNIDDLFDARKDKFNHLLRPATHLIQKNPNRLQSTETIFFTRCTKLASFIYSNCSLNFELSRYEIQKKPKKKFGVVF